MLMGGGGCPLSNIMNCILLNAQENLFTLEYNFLNMYYEIRFLLILQTEMTNCFRRVGVQVPSPQFF